MKLLSDVREFFWPLLESVKIPPQKSIVPDEIIVDDSHLEKTLEYAINFYEAEYDRKKTVEGKSSLFIGTISVVTSVIIGVTSFVAKENDFNLSILGLVLLLFILTIYMLRTIWFSIKALERKTYYTISISDFLISDSDDNYYRKLIAQITNKVRKNSITINSKVDNMTMAQEYFKRAIVVVAIYSFVVLYFFLSKSKNSISLGNFIHIMTEAEVSILNTFIIYAFTSFSLILSIVAIRKTKK